MILNQSQQSISGQPSANGAIATCLDNGWRQLPGG
jgi:hypothetical protein